jgi:succinylglutamate desuccinylase
MSTYIDTKLNRIVDENMAMEQEMRATMITAKEELRLRQIAFCCQDMV